MDLPKTEVVDLQLTPGGPGTHKLIRYSLFKMIK